MKTCRVCGLELFKEPLLEYENMPKAAQFMPDANSLAQDRGIYLEVLQCSGCGLVQLGSGPVPYYRDVIRAAIFSEEMKSFRRTQFDEFVRNYGLKGKKVLEIGCGRGEYLSLLGRSGVDAHGLEHSEDSVKECKKLNLNVSPGFVENSGYEIRYAPFNAFLMLNFLEHLPNPNETLRGIYNNMADGAVGLVEVPNFDMILRKKLFSEFVSDHLLYFTKSTLRNTMTNNGFDVLECNEIWHDYIISIVVRKNRQLDMSDFHDYESKLKNAIDTFVNLFNGGKIAIWGASHQAFTILALADLSEKIEFVVDSAAFKQGKYTPATHIPIVSPETLRSDPVDAVIVMAASYSDEVAMILRRDFDKRMHVAILRDYGLEYLKNGDAK
jgi:SAM-dependent methyltransferase